MIKPEPIQQILTIICIIRYVMNPIAFIYTDLYGFRLNTHCQL